MGFIRLAMYIRNTKKITTYFFNEQEPPRPEFVAMAPAMEENPVTGVKEPYFPEKARISRMVTGSMVIVIMVRPTGVVRGLMGLQNFNWPVRREIMS